MVERGEKEARKEEAIGAETHDSFFRTNPDLPTQVFISFITSTANDICRASKRQVSVCVCVFGMRNEKDRFGVEIKFCSTPPPSLHTHQTLSADDILAALADAGFDELAAPLRDSLAAAAAERAAAAAATKKRKADEKAAADAPPLAAEVE